MQNEYSKETDDETMNHTIEEQLAYINETIKESENEDSYCSDYQEKPPTPNIKNSELPKAKSPNEETDVEASESEIERRECDCCRVVPDEIINMNCVHNICVDCTLNVILEFISLLI